MFKTTTTAFIASVSLAATQVAAIDRYHRRGHYALDKLAREGTLYVDDILDEPAAGVGYQEDDFDKYAIKITTKTV